MIRIKRGNIKWLCKILEDMYSSGAFKGALLIINKDKHSSTYLKVNQVGEFIEIKEELREEHQ